MTEYTPTEEQRAITNFVRAGQGSLLVEALAGTGKSTAVIEALKVIPQQSILVVAFNRGIADNLQAKLPKMPRTHAVHVKTFHALGLGILKKHYPNVEVAKDASEELINQVAGKAISFKMRRAAVRLLQTIKETIATPMPPSAEVVLALGYEYEIFTAKMDEREIGLTVEAVRDAYMVSLSRTNDKFEARKCIDFCDMVWAPVALGLAAPHPYLAIIVDELQDISGPQMTLLMRLMIPGKSRFIGVGDQHQQLYSWRGSLGRLAWDVVTRDLNAKLLPLTTTWRCPTSIVKQANTIVPALCAASDALPGTVTTCTLGDLPSKLANSQSGYIHTFILSRNNADLVDAALFLWRERVMFQLNTGKALLAPIFDLLNHRLDTRDTATFKSSLTTWFDAEIVKAEKVNATAYAEKIEEQRALLLATLKYCKPAGISRLLNEILLPNTSGILMSTVHKVKGLEAERVYLLKETFARYKPRLCRFGDEWVEVTGGAVDQEELNVEYVAITRAKEHLVWVNIHGHEVRETATQTFVMSAPLKDFTLDELSERLQYVELLATRTQDQSLAESFMKHARAIETEMSARC